MPNWKELVEEIRTAGSTYDVVRRKQLETLHKVTGRNAIVYYSGWLQKGISNQDVISLVDSDKNGFMAAIHQLDRKKGLDLFLHTPGGDIAATESLVDYLRAMFGNDIRAFVPQLAMSAGTMIALSCKQIVMGKHSSLGPIDPQIFNLPAHGVIEEFQTACEEVKKDPALIPLWQTIIGKYHPTLIGECQKAISWSTQVAKEWLISGMFEGHADAEAKADNVIKELSDHALTKSHARHISLTKALDIGLNVLPLESDPALQEAALTVHHACILTLSASDACKIIENHNGVAHIQTM
jgi:ATP-dependent protease ClpP protease subunit